MVYEFFISFKTGANIGNVSLDSKHKKLSIEDIREAEKGIQEKFGYENVVITNFIPIRKSTKENKNEIH